jgi:hypothetical protein
MYVFEAHRSLLMNFLISVNMCSCLLMLDAADPFEHRRPVVLPHIGHHLGVVSLQDGFRVSMRDSAKSERRVLCPRMGQLPNAFDRKQNRIKKR